MRPGRVLAGAALLVAWAAFADDRCPDAGYARVVCALAQARASLCGPPVLGRLAARSARAIAAAQLAGARGQARRERVRLQRARDLLFTLEVKAARLVARGRLDGDCEARDAALLAGVLADLGAFPPGPTTTLPATTTTSTAPTLPPSTTIPTPTTTSSTVPDHVCGNGIVERGEQCEGDTGGRTCRDLGFTGGVLGCGADCYFDVSRCTF